MTFRPLCRRTGCRNRVPLSSGDKPRKYCSYQCAATARSARRDEKTPRRKRTDRKRDTRPKATVGKIALRLKKGRPSLPIPKNSESQKTWNAYLAATGSSVKRGEFLSGAPHGRGKPVNVSNLEAVDAAQQSRKKGGKGRPICRPLHTTTWGGKRVKISGYSLNAAKERLPASMGALSVLLAEELRNDVDGNDEPILERMDPPKKKRSAIAFDNVGKELDEAYKEDE